MTAYGLLENITFPLSFEVYKPKARLKPEESYRTKPEIAVAMIRELCSMGFEFDLVLADSLYGESSSSFVRLLHQLALPYVLAIRSNHAMWLPHDQQVRHNRWRVIPARFQMERASSAIFTRLSTARDEPFVTEN